MIAEVNRKYLLQALREIEGVLECQISSKISYQAFQYVRISASERGLNIKGRNRGTLILKKITAAPCSEGQAWVDILALTCALDKMNSKAVTLRTDGFDKLTVEESPRPVE